MNEKRIRRKGTGSTLTGPGTLCRYRLESGEVIEVEVMIYRQYSDDIACVYSEDSRVENAKSGFWIVRGGIDWDRYYALILRHYKLGVEVPVMFKPVKRLPPEVLDSVTVLNAGDAVRLIDFLRQKKYLKQLITISEKSCPRELNWNHMREHFQDFNKKGGNK